MFVNIPNDQLFDDDYFWQISDVKEGHEVVNEICNGGDASLNPPEDLKLGNDEVKSSQEVII